MIDEITKEKLIERLITRIEDLDEYIVTEIARQVKKIGKLSPTKAFQVGQLIKYGDTLPEIINEISRVTALNVQDIYKIFEEYARINQDFSKIFYDAQQVPFIPFEENLTLKRQVEAIAQATAGRYFNLSNTYAFARKDDLGNVFYTSISQTYQDVIDKAILSVSQGKETFEQTMDRTLSELADSGIKTMEYPSKYRRRLDSAVRMNLEEGIRTLHNEIWETFGNEFGADGVEISVHEHPAPDHEDIQGHQLSKEEFYKFQNDMEAKDYQGNVFEPEIDGRDRRAISTLNCYHTTMQIVLGVNEPQYTNEQLKEIKQRNNEGFEINGKHYTVYEGTQIQRKMETKIRKQKEKVKVLVEGGFETSAAIQKQVLNKYTKQYKEFSEISKLPTKMERLKIR